MRTTGGLDGGWPVIPGQPKPVAPPPEPPPRD